MHDPDPLRLSEKAQRVLYGILIALFLIFVRAFYLSVTLHDEKSESARISGRKVVVDTPGRASIRDRFNHPLAINRPRYDVGVLYSDIRTIPRVEWRIESGKKVKSFPRKEHIRRLSLLFAEELGIDPDRIEDEIHAKAAIYNTLPYILKEGITEKKYHALLGKKALWPGLFLRRGSERTYPEGPLAGDLIGYLGAISREEYDRLLQEKEEIRFFLEAIDLGADLPFPDGVTSIKETKKRLSDLEDMAFRLNDSIGKMGIEAKFEKELRGFRGKKQYASDIHGRVLEEYPGGKKSWPGKRILLSLSTELQKEAEELLILREELKETRVKNERGHTHLAEKEPWIKGGAIIAMDPNTGEILALATYPRIDPNDFSKTASKKKITQSLECDPLIQELWDGLTPLTRERYDFTTRSTFSEEWFLSWPFFLETLLSKDGEALSTLQKITTVGKALQSGNASPITHDLLGLLLDPKTLSPELLREIKNEPLEGRYSRMQSLQRIRSSLRQHISSSFTQTLFKDWRQSEEKSFIAEMRAHEKAEKKPPKPYIDYLDRKRDALFTQFWHQYEKPLLLHLLANHPLHPDGQRVTEELPSLFQNASLQNDLQSLQSYLQKIPPPLQAEYIASLRSFRDLQATIQTLSIRKKKPGSIPSEQDLVRAFYPPYGYGFGRSWAFRQAAPQGSIFKLITAYSAIMHPKKGMKKTLNPLSMIDRFFSDHKQHFVGIGADGKPIPQIYKGGRIPKSISSNIGEVDLLSAIEHSSNPYFSLLALDVIESPDALLQSAKEFSFGHKTGIDLPGEIAGILPTDLNENPTGLYATAIGQHTLVVTPLQTSVMLSALANGGNILKPQIVSIKAGSAPSSICEIPKSATDPNRDSLYAIGIDFPFFLNTLKNQMDPILTFPKRDVLRTLPIPDEVRDQLLEGMRRVMVRQTTENLTAIARLYQKTPWLIQDLLEVKDYMVGKSSTAEVLVRLNADLPQEKSLYTHVWFGGILFEEKIAPFRFNKPELVVVVFLRFGGYGKEALPIAARIAKKWREIKKAHKTGL